MTDVDRVGESFRISAAVALDDDTVEPEKDAAVRLARVHLLPQRAERVARQDVAEPREQRLGHGALELLAELAGGAFGGLERDIAGEPLGDHDVDGALADIVA